MPNNRTSSAPIIKTSTTIVRIALHDDDKGMSARSGASARGGNLIGHQLRTPGMRCGAFLFSGGGFGGFLFLFWGGRGGGVFFFCGIWAGGEMGGVHSSMHTCNPGRSHRRGLAFSTERPEVCCPILRSITECRRN